MPQVIFGNILGGVNYTVPPTQLPQYYAADMSNIVPTLTGLATKRGGSSKLNTNAYGTVITSFHELLSSGTSYKFCTSGTNIGKYDGSDFTDHITGMTTGLYYQWINFSNSATSYAICANGTDNPRKTDGSTGSDLTAHLSGLPGALCLAEWGERLWTSVGNTLYGSALRDPTDFDTSTTDIGYWIGTVGTKNQVITGLASFFDWLIIGKLNQLYILTGAPETASSTFRLTPLSTKEKDSIGFTARNAITQVGQDLLFLDGLDIKRLSGISQYGDVESVSIIGSIKDYLRSSSGASLDVDYLQHSSFMHYKKREQIWCTIPTGSSTRYWFIIDYSNRSLREQLGIPLYSFYPMSTSFHPMHFSGVENGSTVDIYAACSDGYVRRFDTGTNDTSTAISSHVTWCLGDPERYISPAHVTLNVKYSTACGITPSYAMGLQDWVDIVNSSNYTTLSAEDLTDSTWQTTGGVATKKISSFLENSGRSFAFKLSHTTASQTFELHPSTFYYRLKRGYFA